VSIRKVSKDRQVTVVETLSSYWICRSFIHSKLWTSIIWSTICGHGFRWLLSHRGAQLRVKLLMVFQNLAPILIGNLPGVFYTSPGGDLIAGWCRISDASQQNVVKKTFFFQETRACPNCGSSVLAKWVTCQKSICEASVWQSKQSKFLKQVEVRHSAGTAGLLLAQFTSSIGTGWSFLICIHVYNLWYVNIYWGMPKPCNSW